MNFKYETVPQVVEYIKKFIIRWPFPLEVVLLPDDNPPFNRHTVELRMTHRCPDGRIYAASQRLSLFLVYECMDVDSLLLCTLTSQVMGMCRDACLVGNNENS